MRPSNIDPLLFSKKESDRKECIGLLKEHLNSFPSDTKSWYDLACCNDFLGQESEAEPAYQAAQASGIEHLSIEDQRGFYVGLGSTLRNIGKLDESFDLLQQGIKIFPDYLALRVFLGFTLHSMSRYKEASRELLTMSSLLPNAVLDGYERAAVFYAKQLD